MPVNKLGNCKEIVSLRYLPALKACSSACLCMTSRTIFSKRELFSFCCCSWRFLRTRSLIRSKLLANFDSSPTSYNEIKCNQHSSEFLAKITSFLVFNSSELKLLSSKAKNKFSTMKFPITNVGRNTARHMPGPWKCLSLLASRFRWNW